MRQSHLYHILSSLSQHSVESVQTGNGFSDIDLYLHTDRPISDELLNRMFEIDEEGGGIIFLVGSAGDGKSHLLSKMKDLHDKWESDSFYNDATASCSPKKTAVETLKEGLKDFSDNNLHSTTKKKIVAINLGKLNAFIENEEVRIMYHEIIKAVEPLFDEDDTTPPQNTKRVKIVEFSNKQIFELYPEKPGIKALESQFLTSILERIAMPRKKGTPNPFYEAYIEDLSNNIDPKNPILLNYQLLSLSEVRRAIVFFVIEAIIRFKLVITPREYLDFIYSILIPKTLDNYSESENFYESLLPTLLFSGGENPILNAISHLDPLKHSSTAHDNDLSLLFTSNKIPTGYIESTLLDKLPNYLIERINKFYDNNGRDVERTTKFLFRLKHLLDYHSESKPYLSFLDLLNGIFLGDFEKMTEAYSLVSETISRHNGSYSTRQDIIPLNIQGGRYKLFVELQMEAIEPTYRFSLSNPWEFYPRFTLNWELPSKNNELVSLQMDYKLYSYLHDLKEGKLPLSYENEKNIEFSHFIQTLAQIGDSLKKVSVVRAGDSNLTLKQTAFNSISFK